MSKKIRNIILIVLAATLIFSVFAITAIPSKDKDDVKDTVADTPSDDTEKYYVEGLWTARLLGSDYQKDITIDLTEVEVYMDYIKEVDEVKLSCYYTTYKGDSWSATNSVEAEVTGGVVSFVMFFGNEPQEVSKETYDLIHEWFEPYKVTIVDQIRNTTTEYSLMYYRTAVFGGAYDVEGVETAWNTLVGTYGEEDYALTVCTDPDDVEGTKVAVQGQKFNLIAGKTYYIVG